MIVSDKPLTVTMTEEHEAMLRAVRSRFLPNAVVLFRPAGRESPAIAGIAPFTKNQTGLDGRATAYVCVNQNCEMPTADVSKMLELLKDR